jgi:hypothetical protein
MMQYLLQQNKQNRDLLELLHMVELPDDLRQIVWRISLENEKVAKEYKNKFAENRMLTLSKYDVQIAKDCEDFIVKYTQVDEFDGTMVYCMKTILSYFEKQRDRILSDYLYVLCIPLVVRSLTSNLAASLGQHELHDQVEPSRSDRVLLLAALGRAGL